MRILLINVPHPAIGSRIPREQLPPLGLLSIGGPLIDAGHDVRLIDGEFGPMKHEAIVEQALSFAPDAVLFGHTGSTSGHPIVDEGVAADPGADAARADRLWRRASDLFLARHPRDEPQIDVIVRGEGEETVVRLFEALRTQQSYAHVPGLAFRVDGRGARDGGGAGDQGSRCVSRRLGADRSQALLLLGRQARGRDSVFARLSASVQLLRPAWVLDALAASRSEEAGGGDRAAASRARRRGVQLRRREPDVRGASRGRRSWKR